MNDEAQIKAVYKDKKTQEMLNRPISDPSGVDPEDQKFLEMLISFIKKGAIDPLKPGTLINSKAYDKLSDQRKGQADLEAFNMLGSIREIRDLYDHGYKDSYQIQYLVNMLRLEKERIENEAGDIFII